MSHPNKHLFVKLAALLGLAVVAVAPLREAGAPVLPFVMDQGRQVRLLAVDPADDQAILVALGELAFKAEAVFETSPIRSAGLQISCDSCHPDGRTSRILFYEGLSDKEGNIDVTNRAISLKEDGINNPVNVPSIAGARFTAPFPRDGRFADLREFTHFALVEEFGGNLTSDFLMEALLAYQNSIEFLDNPLLGADGRLTADAPDAARRGEELFLRPFPNQSGLRCAACHVPEQHFVDGLNHDIGSGDGFDTPTLRDLTISAPYFHDGRHDTLAEVVDYLDGFFKLALAPDEKTDLIAYLETIGGGEPQPLPGPEQVNPEAAAIYLRRVIEADDWLLTRLVFQQLLFELEEYRGVSGAPGDAVIDGWRKMILRVSSLSNSGEREAALAATEELQVALIGAD